MSQHVFLFPDVGEGIHEGRLVEWLAKVGDAIKEDQPLCRVETDKAVVDIPSPVEGRILELRGHPDQIIHVGDPLVIFALGGSSPAAPSSASALATAPAHATHSPSVSPPTLTLAPPSSSANLLAGRPAAHRPRPQEVLATPHTRALARKLGLEITSLVGTGRHGRITDEDVQAAQQRLSSSATIIPLSTASSLAAPITPLPSKTSFASAASAPPVAPPAASTSSAPPTASAPSKAKTESSSEGLIERVPVTFLRRKIAEQMARSRQQLVHVSHFEEADVTELFVLYQKAREALAPKIKLTPLPFFIKAVVACLKSFPIFNSSHDAEKGEILFKKFYNIGIAVDTSEGLVVPVVKDADRKDIQALATEIRDLAARAKERTLKLDELRGGSFTITNIGPIGGVFATPIINYPELAILGLHKIEERPAVVEGEIVIRKKMYLSISFDHQIIDGADAARFMRTLAELLSEPTLLITRF